jgi:quercetin dioxygenase-like cupin family protein
MDAGMHSASAQRRFQAGQSEHAGRTISIGRGIAERARIRKHGIAETIDMQGLISYVDSSSVEWFQFRPGSRWKTLFEDPKTGQRAILVQWDAGYRMGEVDHHDRDEIVYVLSGTFVQNGRSSSPGTYIHHRAGSYHQASTPDGCTFLEIVTGHRARHGRPTAKQLAWFRNLPGCTPTAPPNKSVAAHDSLPRSARTGVSR